MSLRRRKRDMYFNKDAMTIDMSRVNELRNNNELPANTLKAGCFPRPDWDSSDCRTEKQCRQINKELDQAKFRLDRLRRKYGRQMDYFTRNGWDQMYMLDPTNDDPQTFDGSHPLQYALDQGGITGLGPVGCNARSGATPDEALFRINPNVRENWLPEDERYVFSPGTPNTVARKSDLAERRRFRVYPHMYDYQSVIEKEEAKRAQENDVLSQYPTAALGGVDYPVPMRFQLGALQQPTRRGSVDYDMRVIHRSNELPRWNDSILSKDMRIANNVDLERDQQHPVQRAIVRESLRKGNLLDREYPRKFGVTAGVPNADRKDFTCQQLRRQKAQSDAVLQQQRDWYTPSFLRDCGGPPDHPAQPQTRSEERAFRRADVSGAALPTEKYPSQRDEKSSFFGLGPAIPPPDPLLLSNVPSRLIQHRQALEVSENDSGEGLKLRLRQANLPTTLESFDGSVRSLGQDAEEAVGRVFTGRVKSVGASTPFERNVVNASQPALSQEFSIARSSLEKQQKDVISNTIFQQRKALMQISDLRHAIAGLRQRIVDAKAHGAAFDITQADRRIKDSLDAVAKLRDVIRAVTKRRERALSRLKAHLTAKEFGHFRTVLANELKTMETRVRQYHEQPSADRITAYREPHFGGDGFTMSKGFYNYPGVGGLGNNRLKSLKVGANVKVRLWEHAGRRGKMIEYVGPRRIVLLPTMWDNAVSGIEVLDKEPPTIDAYDAPFFQGGHIRLPVGMHDYPDVGGLHVNRLASLRIPEGLNVTLFERPNRQGERVKFIGPQKLAFLPADWNNKVKGILVEEGR